MLMRVVDVLKIMIIHHVAVQRDQIAVCAGAFVLLQDDTIGNRTGAVCVAHGVTVLREAGEKDLMCGDTGKRTMQAFTVAGLRRSAHAVHVNGIDPCAWEQRKASQLVFSKRVPIFAREDPALGDLIAGTVRLLCTVIFLIEERNHFERCFKTRTQIPLVIGIRRIFNMQFKYSLGVGALEPGKHLALCFDDPADIGLQFSFRLLFQQTKQGDPRVKIRRVVPGDGEQIPVGKVPALVCDFFFEIFRRKKRQDLLLQRIGHISLQITSC